MPMERALFARALLAAALLVPGTAVAQAGPDRAATQALVKQCEGKEDFSAPAPPARLYGNTWYVGTCTVSVLLVTSPQGHVLVDAATEEAAPSILANIRTLGFRPEDVRWIVTSHEHWDHVGGLAVLAKATGAKVALSDPAAAVIASGKSDPSDSQFGDLQDFTPATADRIVKAGDVVQVGPLRLTMMATPGHTTGSSSWSWQSCAEKRCETVSYIDSISALAAGSYRFTDHPDVVARFQRTFSAIAAKPCGILVTPHPSASDLFERMLGEKPLASPTACRDYAATGRNRLNALLVRETVK